MHDDCLLWGSRVIIPPPGRQVVLGKLHGGHSGISRMKTWQECLCGAPGMDGDIVKTVQSYHICQQHRPAPPPTPLQPWKWPSHPWSRLHLDYAGPFLAWAHISSGCQCPFSEMFRSISDACIHLSSNYPILLAQFAQFGL